MCFILSCFGLPPRFLQVSTVYNKAIVARDTDIIVNSVIVLFVIDLDEWIFASLKTWNEKWTSHASDSESSSDVKREKEGAIEEMKEEIALQKTQIASQQEEIMLQKDQMAMQNDEIRSVSQCKKCKIPSLLFLLYQLQHPNLSLKVLPIKV